MTSACGSALSKEQRDQVLGGTNGAGAGSGSGATGGTAGEGGTDGGSTGGSSGGGSSGGTAPVACSGTGGATDTGVTANSIKIANVSDTSGPVSGLFEAAQQATKAYVAYVNSTGGVCGRKLELLALDSRTDSRGEQEGTAQACNQAFAMVGSMSAYDQGGAQQAASCGIPDIRAASVTSQRQNVANSFGVNSTRMTHQPTAPPDYFKSKYGGATTKAAFLYLNAEVTKQNAESFMKAYSGRGFNWIYTQSIDIADFNYSPYVVQMKEKGVQYVQWLGSGQHGARLLQAMKQQGYTPQAFVMDATGYDANFVKSAGAAAEGVTVFINTSLVEEGGSNKEQQLYRQWLARVAPNARPDYFGFFAWGAAKLFVQQVAKAGPNLKRSAIIDGLKSVRDYTADGLFAAQDVGGKRPSKCWAFIKLQGGKWVREAPGSGYKCGDVVGV
ncbi:ABC transporter substrate-binding protein [Catelliglobosispora koreensis]|uniref:ABC transporter substrate-binding protein n=1 Tax=Catelliglobosispora koreensis TaxID=129052 RepID=UPI000375215C|nr:ABC transporter substrate-binding protein [Catelliglobosispora koreensis]